MADRKLTPKQETFVREYLVDLNATAAAVRAGYASGDIGRQLLTKTHVQEAIAEAQKARAERTQVTADRVLLELARVAFLDPADVLDFASGPSVRLRDADRIPEDARRAIASIKVKRYAEGRGEAAKEVEVIEFRLCDKLSALDKLGRHLGLFADRVEVTGKDGGPVAQRLAIDWDEAARPRRVVDPIAERLAAESGGDSGGEPA